MLFRSRALALDPKIILLDEPAAGMNPNETNSPVSYTHLVQISGIWRGLSKNFS